MPSTLTARHFSPVRTAPMSPNDARPLSSYADEHGTTPDPRANIETTRFSPSTVADRLHDYETRFPDVVFLPVTLALTGHEPIDEVLTDCRGARQDPDADLTTEQRRQLTDDIQLLDSLADRAIDTIELRRFDTSDETPEAANATAAARDDPYALLAYNATITATAHARLYDAVGTASQQALAINIEPRRSPGPFTVKFGGYKGGFDVHIIDDFETFHQRDLYPDGWRRPQDLTPTEDQPS